MGNFEKLSVLVIVVIIVMILVVALYTWAGDPSADATAVASAPAPSESSVKGVEFTPKPAFRPIGNAQPPVDPIKMLDELDRARKEKERQDALAVKPVEDAFAAAPSAPKEPRTAKVEEGDTISAIAKRMYPGRTQAGIDAILKANPTAEPTRLRKNQVLTIPELPALASGSARTSESTNHASVTPSVVTLKPGSMYVTKKGDTLPKLAKAAYRDANQWHRIWVENFDAISDPDHVSPGTRLKIPVL